MRTIIFAAALACLGLAPVAPLASVAHAVPASPTHEYRFDGNLQDSLGGPALQSLGGSVGAGDYTFGAGQGLMLDGALADGASYSLEFTVRLDQISGLRRLVDFKNGGSDSGLYSFAASLGFTPSIFGGPTIFSTTEFTTILVTRDGASSTVSGYADGVAQFSVVDTAGHGVFSTSGARMVFFRDDTVFPGEEASGSVKSIRVFDRGLTATEVAQLYAPVPEPGTWALTLVGLGALGWVAGRRRGPVGCARLRI